MANYIIDLMLPQALEEAKTFEERPGGIKSKYFGAISSFGTSVISSGLKPTLLFYAAKNELFPQFEDSIRKILNSYLCADAVDDIYAYENTELILDAVIALKLAIRTYEKLDNEGKKS